MLNHHNQLIQKGRSILFFKIKLNVKLIFFVKYMFHKRKSGRT